MAKMSCLVHSISNVTKKIALLLQSISATVTNISFPAITDRVFSSLLVKRLSVRYMPIKRWYFSRLAQKAQGQECYTICVSAPPVKKRSTLQLDMQNAFLSISV